MVVNKELEEQEKKKKKIGIPMARISAVVSPPGLDTTKSETNLTGRFPLKKSDRITQKYYFFVMMDSMSFSIPAVYRPRRAALLHLARWCRACWAASVWVFLPFQISKAGCRIARE